MIQVSEMISEKSRGLKLYLTISGLSLPTHFISWTILNFYFSFYISISLFLCARLSGFRIFIKTSGFIWITFFFLSSFALSSISLLISALAKKSKSGHTFAYSFLTFSFVFQVFMTNPNSINLIYRENWLISKFRYLIEFYPGFNFTKIFSDIVYYAGTIFSVQHGRYEVGKGLEWSQIFNGYSKFHSERFIFIPSIANSFYLLFRNIILIYILAIFFELTLASNQGVSKNPITYIYAKFFAWIFEIRNSKKCSKPQKHISVQYEESFVAEMLTKNIAKLENYLLINGISKSYNFAIFKRNSQRALSDLTLSIKKGELISILGENGAGKTTLMNTITGFLSHDEGNVIVFGYELRKNLNVIRKLTSWCPQSDIYWEELTVFEHLNFFCFLRGFKSKGEIERTIMDTLSIIDLTEKIHEKIKNLSGGMKRRLAIGIAVLGNPKVIIFDEPTVGLDPIKRNKILELIKVG